MKFGRIGVILRLGQDLEQRLALAGHADAGGPQGLGGIRFHAPMVAGGARRVKRLGRPRAGGWGPQGIPMGEVWALGWR